MKSKVLTALVILKISILAVWFFMSFDPFTPKAAIAEVPPRIERPAEVKEERVSSQEEGLILAIRHKEEELRTREDELAERGRHLVDIRGDIETKLTELKILVKELNSVKGKIDSFNNGKARRLVKIYESMTPQDAAARLERLDDEMAASILGSMREKIAGQILGFVTVDKSVRISRVLKKDVR